MKTERKLRRYQERVGRPSGPNLRKHHVRDWYGWESTRSVDRAWKEYKTIPPPDFYLGPYPIWTEASLIENDRRAAIERPPVKQTAA
jgi:hypothetical protein